MKRKHRTKIVATIGPSSSTAEQIEALFMAGVDVFRMNFSHGEHEEHRERHAAIRRLEQVTGRPVGIMMICKARNCASASFPTARLN